MSWTACVPPPGRLLIVTASLVLLLAGCSSSRIPAPIIARTEPGAAARRVEPPVVPAETPAAQVPPPGASAAEAAPVRSGGGVEVRPLDSRPLDASPVVPGASGATAAKSMPRLVKRPYSEVALAEMQASDNSAAVAAAQAGAARAAPSAAASAPSTPVATATPSASGPGGFLWPARGKVIQTFAESHSLGGIMIDGAIGDPVTAVADGKVIFSGPGPRGYGNLVIIKHDDDTVSVYGHNRSIVVKEGQSVKRGQKVAELGDSDSDRPNLLFQVRKQGKPIDPMPLLPKR